MKTILKYISTFICCLVPVLCIAQNNIVKGSGVCYFDSIPTVTINTDYHCEIGIDTSTGLWYEWSRTLGDWITAGFRVQIIDSCETPVHTPGDKMSEILLNPCDSLWRWRAGAWHLISGGGGGAVTGRIDNYVQTGDPSGGLDQQVGLQYDDVTYIMRLDSSLLVNGFSDVATTFRITKTGMHEWNQAVNGDGGWMIRKIYDLQQDEAYHIQWNEIAASFNFVDDPKSNFVYTGGFNFTHGGLENPDYHGWGYSWEYNYHPNDSTTLLELHLPVYVDTNNVGHRIVSYVIDKDRPSNWYEYHTVGTASWNDPTNNNTYARILRDGTGASRLDLVSSASQTGIQLYVNPSSQTANLSNLGIASPSDFHAGSFTTFNVNKMRIAADWGTEHGSDGNPAYLLGGESFYGGVVRVPFGEAWDSVMNNMNLIDEQILFGGPNIKQDAGLTYSQTNDLLSIDSSLIVNGAYGLSPSTVSILKTGQIYIDPGQFDDDDTTKTWLYLEPLERDEGNVPWIESISSTLFAGNPRRTQSFYEGWNLGPNGSRIDTNNTAHGWVHENFYVNDDPGTPNYQEHYDELQYRYFDSLGVEYRIVDYRINRGLDSLQKDDFHGSNLVSQFQWKDPQNEQRYGRIRTNGEAQTYFELFSSESNGAEGIQWFVFPNGGYSQIIPFGMGAQPELYLNSWYKTYINRPIFQNIHDDVEATEVLGRYAPNGSVVAMSFEQLMDSLNISSLPDSVFGTGDSICVVEMGDTICVEQDSFYINEFNQWCLIDQGDTTCVDVGGGEGVTFYTGNGVLTGTPGGLRLVNMDTASIHYRRGTSNRFSINTDAANALIDIRGPTATNMPYLRMQGVNLSTSNVYMAFNGLTDGSFERDYTLGMKASNGSFIFNEGTLLDSDPVFDYIGITDVFKFYAGKKLHLDCIVLDEDSDQGGTGNIMLAQADGTVNWVDTTGLFGGGAGDGNGHFDPTNNADTIRIDTAILADRLHYIGPFSTFSIDEVTGVEIRGSGTFQPLRLTHTGTGHTQMTFSSTDQSWDLGFNQTGTDGFLINDNTANTVPVFIEEGVLDDALRIESTGQLKFAAYDGTPPTGTEFGILAHESDGDIISVDPGSLGGPGGDNIYTVSDSIDNEDRLVFVRNANTLEIELDTLTGDFGAEFQITTQGADTILRAGTFDSGTEYIEIGSGVYPTFSDILYGEMSVLTVNGLTVQQPTNSNTGLGTLYNNANGSTLFIGMVDPAKDSLFLINEDWADESPLDAYLSFDNDLNETKAYRPLIVNQASDAVEGIKIESTKTTDEAATLNLRGRQDGTDNLSSAIYFSNFDDDGGATSPTANLANIKLDRSVGDDEDGILTVNTYKVNGTETTHITADAISESTEINGFRMNQTTTAATSLTASATEQVIYATTSSGFTLTLPDADAMLGMPIKLYAPNASSVTITGGSGDTVTDYSSNFNRPLEMVAFGANLWTVQN